MSLGDFETQKKNLQEQIAAAETEAQFTTDMSEVEKLNKQLEALEANKLAYEDKVEQVETPASENQVKQITELGGTEEELVKREEVQNEKVEEVKEVLKENSEEVKTSEENKKVEGVNGLEREILQQQLRDYSLSLHLNMEAQKSFETMKEKQVASAPFTNSLGTAIMFVEETKKLQDLEKTAIGLPRDSEDQKKAWEKFREFSNLCYAKGGMEVEFRGGESFLLVKGVQGTHVEGVSLQTALEIIIKDQEEKIKEIEGKLKGGE